MSLKALAHKVLERQRHVHLAEKRREQAPEQSSGRHCMICKAVLDDAFFIAIWTGASVCPAGPCLQQALDRAVDDYETPEATARLAKELADQPPR